MNLGRVYIHRYLRLTAVLAFVVLMSVTLYRHVNNGFFPSLISNLAVLNRYQLTNLFSIFSLQAVHCGGYSLNMASTANNIGGVNCFTFKTTIIQRQFAWHTHGICPSICSYLYLHHCLPIYFIAWAIHLCLSLYY